MLCCAHNASQMPIVQCCIYDFKIAVSEINTRIVYFNRRIEILWNQVCNCNICVIYYNIASQRCIFQIKDISQWHGKHNCTDSTVTDVNIVCDNRCAPQQAEMYITIYFCRNTSLFGDCLLYFGFQVVQGYHRRNQYDCHYRQANNGQCGPKNSAPIAGF